MSEVGLRAAWRTYSKYSSSGGLAGSLETLLQGIAEGRRVYGPPVTKIYSFIDESSDVQLFYCQRRDEERALLSSPYAKRVTLIWEDGRPKPTPDYLRRAFDVLMQDQGIAQGRGSNQVPAKTAIDKETEQVLTEIAIEKGELLLFAKELVVTGDAMAFEREMACTADGGRLRIGPACRRWILLRNKANAAQYLQIEVRTAFDVPDLDEDEQPEETTEHASRPPSWTFAGLARFPGQVEALAKWHRAGVDYDVVYDYTGK